MVRYRYALDSEGLVVSAESLVGTRDRDTYHCLSCERELIARVDGKIQQPHFGHKSVGECNGETYLHRLGKQVIVDTYKKCQEDGIPFTIRFNAPRVCNRFKPLTNLVCNIGNDLHEYDLTQYYSVLKVEKRDGEFIPDVSLHSLDRQDDIVYIEIAVTHFLSVEKAKSGKRIIEIPVATEDDIERLRSGLIDDEHAKFLGFYPDIQVVPDAECNCGEKNYYAFYVFKSGKAAHDHGSLRSLQNKIHKMKPNLIWVHLIREEENEDDVRYYEDLIPNRLFIRNLELAQKEGILVKNCYLCKYHGLNLDGSKGRTIFCKTFKKVCDSNEAMTCNRYSLKAIAK